MNGRTNAVSSRGFFTNTAQLKVITDTGSTVTITNGFIIKTQTPNEAYVSQNNSEESVYIFKIEETQFGTYDITTTKNTNITRDSITINEVALYEITVLYEIWLIKNGQVLADFVGRNVSGITSGDSYATMAQSGNIAFLVYTPQLYDLSYYNTITAVIPNSNARSYSVNTCPSFGIGTGNITIDSSKANVSGYTSYKKFNLSSTYIQNGTYTIDISSTSGNFRFALAASGTSSYNGALYISDLVVSRGVI